MKDQFILCRGKLPVDIYGHNIDPHTPANWMSREQADGYAKLLSLDVGYVFTADGPYWFIDIDHQLDSPIAKKLLEVFDGCYVEVSQSGEGYHIFGTGKAPEHSCKNKTYNIEFYTEGRFVLLTGTDARGSWNHDCSHLLPWLTDNYFPPSVVVPGSEWTDKPAEIEDEILIEKMLNTRTTAAQAFGNKASIKDLFNGDSSKLSSPFPALNDDDPYDRSSADAALAAHLAFWTNKNHGQVLRIMQRSELVRDKWTIHKSYLRRTITNAVNRCTDGYSPTREPIMLSDSISIIDDAIVKLEDGDTGAHWSPEVIDAAKILYQQDASEFHRKRSALKSANKEAQITDWTKLIKSNGDQDESNAHADQLVNLARVNCDLFHDDSGNSYAKFLQNDHNENWALDSEGFQKWLSYKAFTELGFTPSPTAITAALTTLKGYAIHEGKEEEVFLRCAPIQDGYLIDQTNDRWTAIKVTATGSEIIQFPEIKFIRSNTATALPDPVEGDISLLWEHVNIPAEFQTLIITFILDSWRPQTPYPVLELCGEQGSAKSTTHACIRQLSDPNRVPLRTAPKNSQDIFVSASNNHQASFENMSNLSGKMQDALCTLSTGGGFATRKLYSDSDESVIEVKRPVIINGISPVATRPDLIDRLIHIDLPKINCYKPAEYLEQAFISDLPQVFGGLLNLFSLALIYLPDINIDKPPRMADFVLLGEAVHKAMNIDKSFMDVFMKNRGDSLRRSIESSPVALAVKELIDIRKNYHGTFKQLKVTLDQSHRQDGEGWPKSPKGLADALRRSAPALRETGIEIEFLGHQRDGSYVSIRKGLETEHIDHQGINPYLPGEQPSIM